MSNSPLLLSLIHISSYHVQYVSLPVSSLTRLAPELNCCTFSLWKRDPTTSHLLTTLMSCSCPKVSEVGQCHRRIAGFFMKMVIDPTIASRFHGTRWALAESLHRIPCLLLSIMSMDCVFLYRGVCGSGSWEQALSMRRSTRDSLDSLPVKEFQRMRSYSIAISA